MLSFSWLKFLRHYGPVPRNDNMYDETIQRSARRQGVAPIEFQHPYQDRILGCFTMGMAEPESVILTGTAGDGKTHLCRQVWEALDGDAETWALDDPYVSLQVSYPMDSADGSEVGKAGLSGNVTIHFIRDLSGWAPQQGMSWEPEKEELLQKFSRSLFNAEIQEVFLIAANDGQLIEAWRRLQDTEDVVRARQLFEDLLVEDRQEQEGVRLKMFNLSRGSSAELFDRAYDAFATHPGWKSCYEEAGAEDEAFGLKCPIRRNYELLQGALVRDRLRALIELCDQNGLHLPIRQLLLLLSNAVLGHPDCKERLMRPKDVPKIIQEGTVSKASVYNNIFGGNLTSTRRQSIAVFDYLERFQIGHETNNRIDNILIFGEGDPNLDRHFTELLKQDAFYGADERYFASRDRYIEGAEEDRNETDEFLELLIAQRRGLFFKIPDDATEELDLWDLTVFRFAGVYLSQVLETLRAKGHVSRQIVGQVIKGLNRIFTGMLINADRELLLATSGNFSQAKISRVLADKISVEPRHGERVVLDLNDAGKVNVVVWLNRELPVALELNLVRFEFLSRVATEGALPASFSKECYEDILAFKSRLLAAFEARREEDGDSGTASLSIRVLTVSELGMHEDRFVEIRV